MAEFNEHGIGCDEHFRMADFVDMLKTEEGSSGLIVIFSGDSTQRLGNIFGYVSGIRLHLQSWIQYPSDNVKIIVAEGKTLFSEEFWIIPKNGRLPVLQPLDFDWKSLKSKTLYSKACLGCEPSYALLTSIQPNLQGFVEILRNNPGTFGSIDVNSFEDVFAIRKLLSKEYGLPKSRFSINLLKNPKAEYSGESFFYIAPKVSVSK